MMRRIFLCLALLLMLVSCSAKNRDVLPELSPPQAGTATPLQCPVVFPAGRWQFVHSIAFHLAKGGDGTALGVVVLDNREIRCALMTIEGLTLFEARSMEGRPVEVSRAVPPFDNMEFTAGLMADVRTILQAPPGKAEYGRLADGAPVWRYSAAAQVTDVLPREDGCWTMHTYSGRIRGKTIRTRTCTMIESAVIPADIELVSSGPAGYSLNMHLISAEKLPTAN
jgi:hypothetical protein